MPITAISAGDKTKLRAEGHIVKPYLAILKPTTLLSARVNNLTIARGDRSIAYDGGSGTFASIEEGQTLWVGSSAGARDIGRVRVKSITGTAVSGTITVDENGIDWSDNDYLTILHNYEVWPVAPRISGSTFYKFYDLAYTDENRLPKPVAIAGPHQAGFLVSGVCVLVVPVGESYATAQGASISTKVVTVSPSTGVTVNPESGGEIAIEYTEPGAYWVKEVVTDDNSKSQATYRIHFIYGAGGGGSIELPYTDFVLNSFNGDFSSGLWSFNITAYGDLAQADIPDGALCLLWFDGQMGGIEYYVNLWGDAYGYNLIGAGHIFNERNSDSLDRGTGQAAFTIQSPLALLNRKTEGGTVSLEAVQYPTQWYYYAPWLTPGRAIHHELRWHSTALACMDVLGLVDNTLGVHIVDMTAGSVLARCNGIAKDINARLVSDRLGRVHLAQDPQLLNDSDRGALTSVMTFETDDISDAVNVSYEGENRAASAFLDGFSFDGITPTPLVAISSGYVDGESLGITEPSGTGTINVPGQVLDSQTDANERVGRLLAAANNHIKDLSVSFPGNYLGVVDIVPTGLYVWGLSSMALKRGVLLNGQVLICRNVSGAHNARAGVLSASASFEAVATSIDGIAGNYPTGYPETPDDGEDVNDLLGFEYIWLGGGGNASTTFLDVGNLLNTILGITQAWTPSDLSTARFNGGNCCKLGVRSGKAGYGSRKGTTAFIIGGRESGLDSDVCDKLQFDTLTAAAQASADLVTAKHEFASVSDGLTYGYFLGGLAPGETAQCQRLDMATETTATFATGDLATSRYWTEAVSANAYGYIFGGKNALDPDGQLSETERINLSTGVTALYPTSDLSLKLAEMGTTIDLSRGVGYISGGLVQPGASYASATYQINFTTEVVSAKATADLPSARSGPVGCSDNRNTAFMCGGFNGAFLSAIIGIDLATEVSFTLDDSLPEANARFMQGGNNTAA